MKKRIITFVSVFAVLLFLGMVVDTAPNETAESIAPEPSKVEADEVTKETEVEEQQKKDKELAEAEAKVAALEKELTEKKAQEVEAKKKAEAQELADKKAQEEKAAKEKAVAEAKKEKEAKAEKVAEAKAEAERKVKAQQKEKEAKAEKERLAKANADADAKAKAEREEYLTVEPDTTMDGWADLNQKEREKLIEHAIAFEIHYQETNNTPVKAVGGVDEFIEIIDMRYEEIQGLDDNYERLRMFGTTVAGQVGVMGYAHRLFEFSH